MNKNKLNITTKTDLFKDYIIELLNNGFKVYAYNKPKVNSSWVIIEKDNKIGNVEEAYFGGLNFSTKHKANRQCGTGFMLNGNDGIVDPTLKNAEETFILYPNWASPKDKESVIKFKSFKDYQKQETCLKYKEVVLQ